MVGHPAEFLDKSLSLNVLHIRAKNFWTLKFSDKQHVFSFFVLGVNCFFYRDSFGQSFYHSVLWLEGNFKMLQNQISKQFGY